jgi:hypothetical protein
MKKLMILIGCLGFLSLTTLGQNEFYNGGSVIHVQNGAVVFVDGEVVNSSGTLTNEGQMEVTGNWNNNGNYQSNISGAVTFSGNAPTNVSGNMTGSNDFYNLIVNKTGSNPNSKRVLLNTNIDVDNSLNLTSGRIATAAHEVYVTNGSVAAITGYPAVGNGTNDRYIDGNLRRAVNATGAYYDFPVGIDPGSLGYQLLRMRPQQLSSTSSMIARFQTASPTPANVVECGPYYTCVLSGHGEWILTPNQGNPTYDLSAMPRNFSADCGAGTYTLQLGSQLLGDPCVVFNGIPNPVGGTEIPRTGLTTFAPIAVTGSGGVLPVELLAFEGRKEGSTVVLDWLTDHEINNDYFVVERSSDRFEFSPIGQVNGKGTTDQISEYQLTDHKPLTGKSYYRLKQVDFDGKYTFSQVVDIFFDGKNQSIIVAPNPFKDYFEVYLPEGREMKMSLYNLHGQEIGIYSLDETQTRIESRNLASGIYYYRIMEHGKKVAEGKMIRQ